MKCKNLFFLVIFSALISVNASAQSVKTSTKSSKDLLKKLAENTSLLLYVGLDHIGTTDSYEGYSQTNIAYLTYNLSKNDSLRLESRVSIRNPNGEEADTSFSRSVLRYRRANILTQEKDGVNLSASIEKRYYPEADMRATSNTYGLNRVSLSASRTINDVLSVGATAYVALMDLKDKTNIETSRNYYYLILSETIALPSEFNLTFVEEFFKNNNKADKNEYNSFDLTAEVSKDLTNKIGSAFYVAGTPISSTSNSWDYDNNWVKNLRYGVSFTYSAF